MNPQNEKMIRYLKLAFRGPENSENLYCTLTSVKVFGKGMHLVMRNSLLDLNEESEESLLKRKEQSKVLQKLTESVLTPNISMIPLDCNQNPISDFIQDSHGGMSFRCEPRLTTGNNQSELFGSLA